MKTKNDRDHRVQRAVIAALESDPRIRASDVGVQVHEGIVTLCGAVRTWGMRAIAQEVAHAVEGASDVVNDIVVVHHEPASCAELEVARAVRAALETWVPTMAKDIRTTITDGVVTIEGIVTSLRDGAAVVRSVKNTPGVRRVQNWLIVRAPRDPKERLSSQVARALARHAEHAAKHVDIAIDGDVIKLAGSVRSECERDAIVGAAKGIGGGFLIDTRDLRIVP